MSISRDKLFLAARWAALGSAAAILLSIWASQRLLELSLLLLLASRARLRLPRIWLPISLFVVGTLLSLAFSSDPSQGWPPIKKLYLFSMILVIYSTVRDLVTVRRLMLAWGAIGAFASLWAIGQFIADVRQASLEHREFYSFYLPKRITGAMNHWMTFAGEEMLVLLMLLAFLLFAPSVRRMWIWISCTAILAIAILLNETRTVWGALAITGFFLLWCWHRRIAVAMPVVVIGFLALVPGPLHQRFVSLYHPKDMDSNAFRYVMRRVGWEVIKVHPIVGLGPEELKYHLKDWIPQDIPRPLPDGFYQHLHNIYLQYAAERGIPTMLMMVWALLLSIYDFSRAAYRLPKGRSNARFILLGGIACVAAIMISGLAEHNLGDSEVLTTFLVVISCGYLAVEESTCLSRSN